MQNIEYLLENPSLLSIKFLQIDPDFKPLLTQPEFKKLTEKYSKK
jgi:hypothetical protein